MDTFLSSRFDYVLSNLAAQSRLYIYGKEEIIIISKTYSSM